MSSRKRCSDAARTHAVALRAFVPSECTAYLCSAGDRRAAWTREMEAEPRTSQLVSASCTDGPPRLLAPLAIFELILPTLIPALIRSTTLLALVVFPMAVGLGVVAPTLVEILLPSEWQGVSPLLTALAVHSVVRPIGWTMSSYLQARDRPVAVMLLQVVHVVVLLTAISALSPLGPVWSTLGVGVAFSAHAIGSVRDGLSLLSSVMRRTRTA